MCWCFSFKLMSFSLYIHIFVVYQVDWKMFWTQILATFEIQIVVLCRIALCSLVYGYCVGLVTVARLRWWQRVDLSWLPDGLPSLQNKSPTQIRNGTGLSSNWLYPWSVFANREYHPALNRRMTLYLHDDPYPHVRCWTPHVTVYRPDCDSTN